MGRDEEIAAMGEAIGLRWNGHNTEAARSSGRFIDAVAARSLAEAALKALEKVRGKADV